MDLDLAIKQYLLDCEVKNYTARTLKSMRERLRIWRNFCIEEGVTTTEEMNVVLVKEYITILLRRKLSTTYIRGILSCIKTFIDYCYKERYSQINTKLDWFNIKVDKPVIKAFSSKDIKTLLDSCKGSRFLDVRDKTILTLFFETGIRCAELINMQDSDIKEDYIIVHGKNHKDRLVPITPILQQELSKHQMARAKYFKYRTIHDDYTFLSQTGRILTTSAVEHILKKRGEGIKDVRISPHTCRHTFAQQQALMGTDVYTISRILGHENVQITQTYLNSLEAESIVKMARGRSVLGNLGKKK